MKILLTGAFGFLGNYIKAKIENDSRNVVTIGRNKANDFQVDLSKDIPSFKNQYFNFVIHSAGKAHSVPNTNYEKEEFYSVNVRGTKNLLSGLDLLNIKPESFVFISTVAVYGLNNGFNVNETAPLNALDAYGHSKILAEKMIEKWCKENKVICTILRLPLVVGKNSLGNLKSMINGIKKGYYVNIGGGQARKSMVLAKDVAEYIYTLHFIGGVYNITDGFHPSFFDLSEAIAIKSQSKKPKNIPLYIALMLARIGDLFGKKFPFNTVKFLKITSDLTFDDTKARSVGWKSTSVLEDFNIL